MNSSSYIRLAESGELEVRTRELLRVYEHCTLCPHQCSVNRAAGERGMCRAGILPVVASANAHFGEEPPISGTHGSGTIFFSYCTGSCLFCQNYPISQLGTGAELSIEQLAGKMRALQARGCHNINVVTPTHFVPSLVAALACAVQLGLSIPVVYNTSGYESLETLKMLAGIVDIYLPDIKYADDEHARRISGFHGYVHHNRAAIQEMYRQAGTLECSDGIAQRGCIVRHLILPEGLAGTEDCMRFLAVSVSPDIHVSLMDQYFPAHKAVEHPSLARKITPREYQAALESFHAAGLVNGWIQNH